MVTRYAIVALALFVIFGEVRSLKCYVCTKCLNIPEERSKVEERDNCSACVIEDKFVLRTYVQTDRLCAPCPNDNLVMINNNKSYYHCCNKDLCLGSKRTAWDEIPPDAKTGVKHKETTVNKSVKVTTTKPENSMTQNGVTAPSTHLTSERATQNLGSSSDENEQLSALKPTLPTPPLDTEVTKNDPTTANPTRMAEGTEEIPRLKNKPDEETMGRQADTVTQESGSSPTAVDHRSVSNEPSPKQPSGTAIPTTTTAVSTTAAKPEESIPVSSSLPSMESNAETATENVRSSSEAHPKTSVMDPTLPTQPVNTDTTHDDSTTADTRPVAGGNAIPKGKIEDKPMEVPAESTTQNLESSSPTTCQTNVRYLAFSLSLVCGFVACFN